MKRIVIIGGVAGGMSAATRLRRLDENSEIVVVEKSGFVSYANCGLPYYIGGVISKEQDLLRAGRLPVSDAGGKWGAWMNRESDQLKSTVGASSAPLSASNGVLRSKPVMEAMIEPGN